MEQFLKLGPHQKKKENITPRGNKNSQFTQFIILNPYWFCMHINYVFVTFLALPLCISIQSCNAQPCFFLSFRSLIRTPEQHGLGAGCTLVLRRCLQHILIRSHIQMEHIPQAFWKQTRIMIRGEREEQNNPQVSVSGHHTHWKATDPPSIPRRWDIILMKLLPSAFRFCVFNFPSLVWNPYSDTVSVFPSSHDISLC